jgi:hypothetical protein
MLMLREKATKPRNSAVRLVNRKQKKFELNAGR